MTTEELKKMLEQLTERVNGLVYASGMVTSTALSVSYELQRIYRRLEPAPSQGVGSDPVE
jgi:hypothetical protein